MEMCRNQSARTLSVKIRFEQIFPEEGRHRGTIIRWLNKKIMKITCSSAVAGAFIISPVLAHYQLILAWFTAVRRFQSAPVLVHELVR
jgi:hypothetical protein